MSMSYLYSMRGFYTTATLQHSWSVFRRVNRHGVYNIRAGGIHNSTLVTGRLPFCWKWHSEH